MRITEKDYEAYPPMRSTAFLTAGAKELQFFFVRGMPLIITVKIGHETWKIANGRRAVAHSFSHDDSAGFTWPDGYDDPQAAGRVFTICQPDFINVRLLPLKSDADPSAAIIIPIAAKADKQPMERFLKHAPKSTKDAVCRASTPAVRNHAVEPAFSITYNKLQGATVDRLILVLHDLSSYKLGHMSVQKLYVALSRVRSGKHMAIYPAERLQLQYLSRKTNPPALQAWDSHYDSEGRWKTEPVVLTDVDSLLDKVWAITGTPESLQKADKKLLKPVCRAVGIHFTSVGDLHKSLLPIWTAYLHRRHPQAT